MKNVSKLLLFVFATACTVHAQTTTSLRDDTGFGLCAQCDLLGNEQVLQSCSEMWLEIVERCSSPECTSQYTIDSSINTRTCTNTPPPLPGATGTTTYTGARDSSLTSGGNTTRTTRTPNSTATSAPSTTSASGTTSRSGSSGTTSPGTTTLPTTTVSTTSGSAGSFSQPATTAGAAIGSVPGWVGGSVFVAGWVFAL